MYGYGKHNLLRPPLILGRRLLPLNLGHIDLLSAIEHPVLITRDLEPQELVSAVLICSLSYSQAQKMIRRGTLLKRILRMCRYLVLFNVPEAAVKFQEYFDVFLENPPRFDGKPVRARVPWHLSVFQAIQEKTNLTPAETWETPLPRIFELFAAICAAAGDESLIPPGEYGIWDELTGGKK